MLRPIQERRAELLSDLGAVHGVLAQGAERAQSVAGETYRRAAGAVGLLPPT